MSGTEPSNIQQDACGTNSAQQYEMALVYNTMAYITSLWITLLFRCSPLLSKPVEKLKLTGSSFFQSPTFPSAIGLTLHWQNTEFS